MYDLYDWEINYALMNMLDSHDMARALWIMGEDTSALKLCATAMMTLPGAPCIYYGDEIGLSAAGDPYCRDAFPWDDESSWDQDLLAHYKRVIGIRNKYPVFRTGSFETLYAEDKLYAHHRKLEDQEALIVFNVAEEPTEVQIPLPGEAWDGQSSVKWQIDAGVLKGTVPGRDTLILLSA